MSNSSWDSNRNYKATGTKFTPAGYDYNGFNADGFDRYGYDKDGFKVNNMDRFGNLRGTGFTHYMTSVLGDALHNYNGENFRQGDLVPSYNPHLSGAKNNWHTNHWLAFKDLVSEGYFAKSGRRFMVTEKGQAKVVEIEALRNAI